MGKLSKIKLRNIAQTKSRTATKTSSQFADRNKKSISRKEKKQSVEENEHDEKNLNHSTHVIEPENDEGEEKIEQLEFLRDIDLSARPEVKNRKRKREESSEEEVEEQVEQVAREMPIQSKLGKKTVQPITEDEFSKFTPREQILHVMKQKEAIAKCASHIVENFETEKEVFVHLNRLHSLCSDADMTVKRLAIYSEMTVFKDIVPSYVIKETVVSENQEKPVKLSKKTYDKERHETQLLNCYRRFLSFLEQTVKETKLVLKQSSAQDLSFESVSNAKILNFVCIKAQTFLLTHCFHFNYFENLITAVVPLVNSNDIKVSKLSFGAVVEVFQNDARGDATLEICKLITLLCKNYHFKVKPNFIRCFLHIKITEQFEINPLANKEKKKNSEAFVPKRARKKAKLDKIIQKELQEAEAEYSKEQKKKKQSQILDSVFTTFFRVLTSAPESPLLPTVLDGIALFTHLISVDFMTEIIRSIETFAKSGSVEKDAQNKREVSAALVFKCALVVFQAMKTQGYCIDVDVKDFYTLTYRFLIRCNEITVSSKEEETLEEVNFKSDSSTPYLTFPRARVIRIALQTIELMICEQKTVPVVRVASFLKRLFMIALTFRPWEVQAVIQIAAAAIARFPLVGQLLSSDPLSGNGLYRPDVDEPDYANPFASPLWELSILHQTYHPLEKKSLGNFLASNVGKNSKPLSFPFSPSLYALTSANEWRGMSAKKPIHRTRKNPRETPMDSKSYQRKQKGLFYPNVQADLDSLDEQNTQTFPQFTRKIAERIEKTQLSQVESRMKNSMLLFSQQSGPKSSKEQKSNKPNKRK